MNRENDFRQLIPPPPKPSGLRGAFQIRTSKYPWGKAIGAALTMGISMSIGLSLGQMQWGLFASVGGFAALYVHNEPYARRAVKLILIAFGLAISLGLGSLCAASAWTMALALAFVSVAATFVSGAWRMSPPGGYFFILACALGTGLPLNPPESPLRAGFALIGGAVAWVIGMSGWLLSRHKPETAAVANAYRAVAGFLAATGHPESAQHNAALTLQSAEDAVVGGILSRRCSREWHRLFRMYEKCNALFLAGIALRAEARGPVHPALAVTVRALADMVFDTEANAEANADGSDILAVPKPSVDTPARWRIYRELQGAADIAAGQVGRPDEGIVLPRKNIRGAISSAFDRHAMVLPNALRIGITVAAATIVAYALGNDRPYWVPLTCACVLQGATHLARVHRTIQRSVGTALGVLIGGGVLASHMPAVLLILSVMAFQLIVELIIVRNYGLAVIVITPLPLILAEAGFPSLHVFALVEARLFDTLLGCAIGAASIFVMWPRGDSVRLPVVLARTIRCEAKMIEHMIQHSVLHPVQYHSQGQELNRNSEAHQPPEWNDASRALQSALINLRAAYDVAINELGRGRIRAESLWPAVIAAQRIGYFAMAALQPSRVPFSEEARVRLMASFEACAMAAANGHPPENIDLTGLGIHPKLEEELTLLQETLQIGERVK